MLLLHLAASAQIKQDLINWPVDFQGRSEAAADQGGFGPRSGNAKLFRKATYVGFPYPETRRNHSRELVLLQALGGLACEDCSNTAHGRR